MIKFTLRCDHPHTFESWFRDSASFEAQRRAGHVECPVCGSAAVEKALMAPAVRTSRKMAEAAATSAPDAKPQQTAPMPVAMPDEQSARMRAMLRALREHVVANSTDVGAGFATEARRIHDGLAEERPIHGAASPAEVKALVEDGIEVMPLPVFPDDRN